MAGQHQQFKIRNSSTQHIKYTNTREKMMESFKMAYRIEKPNTGCKILLILRNNNGDDFFFFENDVRHMAPFSKKYYLKAPNVVLEVGRWKE